MGGVDEFLQKGISVEHSLDHALFSRATSVHSKLSCAELGEMDLELIREIEGVLSTPPSKSKSQLTSITRGEARWDVNNEIKTPDPNHSPCSEARRAEEGKKRREEEALNRLSRLQLGGDSAHSIPDGDPDWGDHPEDEAAVLCFSYDVLKEEKCGFMSLDRLFSKLADPSSKTGRHDSKGLKDALSRCHDFYKRHQNTKSKP